MKPKQKKPDGDQHRKAANLTIDPALRVEGHAVAERLGVPFARLVDVGLREELRRQGVAVNVPPGADGAIERMVREARAKK